MPKISLIGIATSKCIVLQLHCIKWEQAIRVHLHNIHSNFTLLINDVATVSIKNQLITILHHLPDTQQVMRNLRRIINIVNMLFVTSICGDSSNSSPFDLHILAITELPLREEFLV